MLKNLILLALLAYSLQIDHCLSEQKVCQSCKTGFNLLDSGYIYCDKNTKIAFCTSESEDKCLTCQTGYEPNNDKTQCVKKSTIQHCDMEVTVGGDTLCYSCESGYLESKDKKSCIKNVNCKKLNEEDTSKCDECNDYYLPNSKGKCELSFCSSKDDKGKCVKCFDQFYLNDNDECVKIPFDYCKDGDEEECFDCLSGFELEGKKTCKKKVVEDCSEKKECTSCPIGYNLDDGKCVDSCEKYNAATKCMFCDYNYILIDDGTSCKSIKNESNNSKYISFSTFIYMLLFYIL